MKVTSAYKLWKIYGHKAIDPGKRHINAFLGLWRTKGKAREGAGNPSPTVRVFCRSLRSRLQFGIDTLHAIMLLAKYVQGGRKTVQTSK